MSEEKRLSQKETWRLVRRMLGHIQELLPGMIAIEFARSAISAVRPFIAIFVSAWIINALYAGKTARQVLTGALIGAASACAAFVIESVLNGMSNASSDKLNIITNNEIGNAFLETDYERLEQPDYQKRRLDYMFMRTSIGVPTTTVLSMAADVVRQFTTILVSLILALPVFLTSGDAWPVTMAMIALVAISLILSAIVQRRKSSLEYKYANENIMGNRYFSYITRLAGNYRIGMEVRVFRAQALLRKLGQHIGGGLYDRWGRDEGRYNSATEAISQLINGTIYIIVALRALAGAYPLGSVVQYVGALVRLSSGMGELISKVMSMRANFAYLETYFAILDAKPIKYAGTLSTEKRDDAEFEIEFHDVSFKYPGNHQYALKNLNLKLHIGQHLAVVGQNGSGKTTMIKLLCRLYDPTVGLITLNGIDICKYDLRQYMNLFSVVFQDFKLFSFKVGENVAADTTFDRERVIQCCEKVGYPGIDPDTVLYKDLDEKGIEISGGEAQKLALSRALYRNAPFMVLDEPTAALDPVAEFDIYTRFNTLMAGHTAIYISHRLSSCRFCDDIVVFQEGELVQRGRHEKLITDEKGLYHALWSAQAQYYTENNLNKQTIDK